MHSITFAKQTYPIQRSREVRVTEKVKKEGVFIYSRRTSSYKVILNEIKIPLDDLKMRPQMYIYKNIQDKRKFFSWKVMGVLKLPKTRKKSCLIAYEHSFWMFIKDQVA